MSGYVIEAAQIMNETFRLVLSHELSMTTDSFQLVTKSFKVHQIYYCLTFLFPIEIHRIMNFMWGHFRRVDS